jgi:hypothetical protein
MNNESTNKKSTLLKTTAIVAFIFIITAIAWLSVQLVNIMPDTFSSLASLAESVNQRTTSSEKSDAPVVLTVNSNKTIVNTGEPVALSWNTALGTGEYAFSYTCTNGVSLDIIDTDGGIRNITCDTNYNVGDINSLTLSAESERARYENISYTISFLGTDINTPVASGTASFTIINSEISDIVVQNDTETNDSDTVDTDEVEVIEEEEKVVTVTPATTPVYEQEFVYEIPTSDPDGQTDLSTKFLATGNILGNIFITGDIEQEDKGAIQFEVKNYGTKTSNEWSYSVTLPSGGTYESPDQKPLKPNERALITVGFPTTDDSSHRFVVTIEESTDENDLNDSFRKTINFKN